MHTVEAAEQKCLLYRRKRACHHARIFKGRPCPGSILSAHVTALMIGALSALCYPGRSAQSLEAKTHVCSNKLFQARTVKEFGPNSDNNFNASEAATRFTTQSGHSHESDHTSQHIYGRSWLSEIATHVKFIH